MTIKSKLEHDRIKSVIIRTKDGKTEVYSNIESVQVLDSQNHAFEHTNRPVEDDRQTKLPFNHNK